MSDPTSRYDFPLLQDRIAYPSEPPLSTPIAELSGFWLQPRCCGQTTSYLPCRLLAAQHGWNTPLSAVCARLRCRCGERPATITMTDRPDRMGSDHGGGPEAWTMDLPIARNPPR